MSVEVEFLFDNQLIAAVENLIKFSKHKLMLISPYIAFDNRIKDALNEKKSVHNFQLLVLFGKNESNYLKSIKKDSLSLLKEFPNVEIRYSERLHAKYYENDFEYIMTSLNLYDYSLANNIEVGVKGQHSSRGILGKAIDATGTVLENGISKIKQDVLGMDGISDHRNKFQRIFETSELKYKTQPKVSEKGGISGLVGYKNLDGYTIIVNKLEVFERSGEGEKPAPIKKVFHETAPDVQTATPGNKCMSASQLSKVLGVQARDITILMQKNGFINGDSITKLGMEKGLLLKNYMGKDYIVYPAMLTEFNEIK